MGRAGRRQQDQLRLAGSAYNLRAVAEGQWATT
jgi:hypothetical protein